MKFQTLLIILFFTSSTSTISFSQNNKKTIAFLYFDNNSLVDREELAPLSKGLTDMFVTEFSKLSNLKVVERVQLEKLLQEMALGQTGLLEKSSAQQVGNMLGAQFLVFGSFMNMPKNRMRLDARIVNVETGLIIKAEEETGKRKDFYKLVTKLVAKIIKNLHIRLTKVEANKLFQIENKSFDATLLYSRGLEFEDKKDYPNAIKMYQKALKENPQFNSAKTKLSKLMSTK
jgi:TolB-like protein